MLVKHRLGIPEEEPTKPGTGAADEKAAGVSEEIGEAEGPGAEQPPKRPRLSD